MVSGTIAALLVELFPTRVRCASVSLPHHFGNGWFGGMLPSVAFAMAVQTGNMYSGMWFPIVIAVIAVISVISVAACAIDIVLVIATKGVDLDSVAS